MLQPRFLKIGPRYIPVNKILEIDTHFKKYVRQECESRYFVHLVTSALEIDGDESFASASIAHDYPPGSPEANAIIVWLDTQSNDLLAPHFYVTLNLYAGHVGHMRDAAVHCGAQLLAVDHQALKDITDLGYRDKRSFFLFSVPAPTSEAAQEVVERIEQYAAEMEVD